MFEIELELDTHEIFMARDRDRLFIEQSDNGCEIWSSEWRSQSYGIAEISNARENRGQYWDAPRSKQSRF